MKYLYAFLGAIYGTIIGCLILPILASIQVFKNTVIPAVRLQPLVVLNPLKILSGIGLIFISIIIGLVLGVMVGGQTAIASYHHGWKVWSAPFKLAMVYTFDQHADGKSQNDTIQNIIDISKNERSKRLEAAIAAHAKKTNTIIKRSIDFYFKDKTFPLEISAKITAYTTGEYKESYGDRYYRSEIVIGENDAAVIAEKSLLKNINKSHIQNPMSWSARFFPCLGRRDRNLEYHDTEKSGYKYKR